LTTDLPTTHQSVRFTFDSLLGATQGLIAVLLDAATSEREYRFSGLSPAQIKHSGLLLEGDVADLLQSIEGIKGCTRRDG